MSITFKLILFLCLAFLSLSEKFLSSEEASDRIASGVMQLKLVTQSKGAACTDGTPPGYYYA